MRSGSVVSTPTTPIANPDPVSARTSSGIAVLVIELPNELIPWPNNTVRKSRLSRSRTGAGPAGRSAAGAKWTGTSSGPVGPGITSPGSERSVVVVTGSRVPFGFAGRGRRH